LSGEYYSSSVGRTPIAAAFFLSSNYTFLVVVFEGVDMPLTG
jgi:hypothetical protein